MPAAEIIKSKCFKCNKHLQLQRSIVGMHFAVYVLHCSFCKIEVEGGSKEEVGVEWLKLVAEHEEQKEKKFLEYLDRLSYKEFFDKMKGIFNDIKI